MYLLVLCIDTPSKNSGEPDLRKVNGIETPSENHSPIIGWAFDGNPIYGPYGYSDPTDQSSEVQRMESSYSLKSELVYNDITNPYPVRTAGPLLNDEPAGKFVEDYDYVFVFVGDSPFIKSELISKMLSQHISDNNDATILSAVFNDKIFPFFACDHHHRSLSQLNLKEGERVKNQFFY